MKKRYTKAHLEEIVFAQLENLNAMHDLLGILKFQNNLILKINTSLKQEISEFKEQQVKYPTRRRRTKA
ncbi:MAG: hypothetical protein JKY44_10360 [Flavobacteriaceae bacterium]|nr:hypothetical protein [Flavobacteriaceae bacterium]